jgi:hypothetical protein
VVYLASMFVIDVSHFYPSLILRSCTRRGGLQMGWLSLTRNQQTSVDVTDTEYPDSLLKRRIMTVKRFLL